MWVDSTKSYKTTCNNSDASIRFEVSCKFEKRHQKVDQRCPMKVMYLKLKLRIKEDFKAKTPGAYAFGVPRFHCVFAWFDHIDLEHISCRPCLILRIRYRSQGAKGDIPTKSSSNAMSNNFWSILIGARLCMKHGKCFVCPFLEHTNKVCFLKRFSQIPACDTIADQWSGNTCSWPSGLGQLRDSMDRTWMGTKPWLLPWDPRQDSWTENGYWVTQFRQKNAACLQQITIYFQVKWVFPWRKTGNFSILRKIFNKRLACSPGMKRRSPGLESGPGKKKLKTSWGELKQN